MATIKQCDRCSVNSSATPEANIKMVTICSGDFPAGGLTPDLCGACRGRLKIWLLADQDVGPSLTADIPKPGENIGSNNWKRQTIGPDGAYPRCQRRKISGVPNG